MTYTCKICGQVFESNKATIYASEGAITRMFNIHLKKQHNISLEEYIVNNYFNGEIPKCNCGCGELLHFRPKNSLWNPLESFGKYVHCGHVGRNNEQMRNKNKDFYKSKYDNIEWIKSHYYEQYGQENIENSAKDFLENNSLTNIDIATKYGIDIRTLKFIWYKLDLITKEQWSERCKYRKYSLSNKRRRKQFENKDVICHELFDIIKNNPLKYNIRSLVRYYNDNNLLQIDTDIPVILEEMENIFGEEFYNYLEYSFHSKEEREFFYVLRFFLGKKHLYKSGFALQYGNQKRNSYIYDMLIDNKYILEYDGIYYHKSKKDRDKEKEQFAINSGYKFLRIPSEEMKNIDTFKRIIDFVNND